MWLFNANWDPTILHKTETVSLLRSDLTALKFPRHMLQKGSPLHFLCVVDFTFAALAGSIDLRPWLRHSPQWWRHYRLGGGISPAPHTIRLDSPAHKGAARRAGGEYCTLMYMRMLYLELMLDVCGWATQKYQNWTGPEPKQNNSTGNRIFVNGIC